MNNKQLAAAFAAQSKESARGSNFYFDGAVCYSYGSHFPAAVIRGNRAFINSDRYSMSTGRHLSYLRQALTARGYVLTERGTDGMRELVNNGT